MGACQAAQGEQAGEPSAVVGRGGGRAAAALVAAADRRAAQARSSRGGGDAHQPRDHLSLALCPIAGRVAPPADRAAAHRPLDAPRRGRAETRGRIPDMVSIAQRPPEVDDRRVPGHWEGDLIIGAGNRSAVATLVERHTRYVLLARLTDRTTATVIDRAPAAHQGAARAPDQVADLGPGPRAGRPQALHRAHRHRGLLLRSALALATRQQREHQRAAAPIPAPHRQPRPGQPSELDQIAAELNGRPRKTLDWATPAEKMDELLR